MSSSSTGRDLAAEIAENLRREHESSIENPEEFLDEKDELEFDARKYRMGVRVTIF